MRKDPSLQFMPGCWERAGNASGERIGSDGGLEL
jgi:hypothetical protein